MTATKKKVTPTLLPRKVYTLRSRYHDHTHLTPLWLYPELDLSSVVGECDSGTSGEEQLAYYVDYVRREYPHYWDNDAVPIGWTVAGDSICEDAPCHKEYKNFDTFYYTPNDPETGQRLNWFMLPVINHRFPQFAKALGWSPSPFQMTAPLRSICRGRP